MKATFKEHALSSLAQAQKIYSQDLQALPKENLTKTAGGSARCACDFSYEVAVVNDRIFARMQGRDPGVWPFADGWAVAPEDCQSLDAINSRVHDSLQNMIDFIETLEEDKITERFDIPGQEKPSSIGELAAFAGMHTMYHAAQLNFIQSLNGDLEVHWN